MAKKVKPWKVHVDVPTYGTTRVRSVDLEIDIDWQHIALQLARQALRSKHRKATKLTGAIRAKIVGGDVDKTPENA